MQHVIIGFYPEEFQNGEHIKTTTLWTGNDKHSEIKLKAEGGYIVVPPSLHTGNTWRYNVEIIESDGSGSKTNYEVTMNKDYYLGQTGDV